MPRKVASALLGNMPGGSPSARRAAKDAALAALRRCHDALAHEAPCLTGEDRERILDLLSEAQRALEIASAPSQRPTTRALLQRLATLERQLATWPAGERAAAIRARLGLCRSRYYELRRLLASPGNIPGRPSAEVVAVE